MFPCLDYGVVDGIEQFHAEFRNSDLDDNEVYRVSWTVGPGNRISIDPAWSRMAGGLLAASDMMSHVKRDDISYPELLNSNDGNHIRELIIQLEARHIMSYLLPKLGSLCIEDILEVRARVANTREGFAFHVQEL